MALIRIPWKLNLRQKVILGLAAGILGIGFIGVVSYHYLRAIEFKQHFVEVADDLSNITLEIRRYEKNFLLYGSKEDLKLLLALVKPKFAIPIGGNPRHQRAYAFLAQEMGIASENIFELLSGEILEFKDNHAKITGKIKLKKVFTERNKV